MNKQRELGCKIVRSDARIRESVRSLPKGHFQQIRQMFDKQSCSTNSLSTIYEPERTHVLLRLPVTDDEKLQHTTAIHDKALGEHYRDYLAEYHAFRSRLTTELSEHQTMYPTKHDDSLLTQSISLPYENDSNQELLSYTQSLPQQLPSSESEGSILTTSDPTKRRQLNMSSAVNYTDSYDSTPSNHFNRTGSSRQYASTLQNAALNHTKTTVITTYNPLKSNTPPISNETYDTLLTSRRLHSSTSLSSTGYDSNSSPSIKSKRNSVATNNSTDPLVHSTYSSSSSSSPSSDEQHHLSSKTWIQYKSIDTTNPTFPSSTHNDSGFDHSDEPSPLISRTQIKLSQPTFEPRPITTVRHATVRNAVLLDSSLSLSPTFVHEPIIGNKKTNNTSYIVQTTSFPDTTDGSIDSKIRRWNNISMDRLDTVNTQNKCRKYPLASTGSTGFQVLNSNNVQERKLTTFSPIIVQKPMDESEKSPSLADKDSVGSQLPPRKPPRTFQNDNKSKYITKTNDQKVPSSIGSSPTYDIGARSISCMDLTAGAAHSLLPPGLRPLKPEASHPPPPPPQSSTISERTTKTSIPNETISEQSNTPSSMRKINEILFNRSQVKSTDKKDVVLRTPTTKTKENHAPTAMKSAMKKGVSEPNLAKTSSNKSPFSPRGLFDRFKRILPLTTSKQSLNEKSINDSNVVPNDSDDSASTSSENNDQIRTSRLDHVSRVKNVCDSLGNSSHMSSLLTDPSLDTSINELTNLYEYVVHILPEQEFGYFANGNGCLLTSNLHSPPSTPSTSIRFKYPFDASDEPTLKYFCFPDQHDSNNNPLILTKKTSQEYFRFTLTNMHGSRQYGYCSRFFHKGVLNALCIVSPYDMIDIYEKILSTATELFISYKDDDARRFLQEIYAHRLPNRGDTIHIDTTTVGLYTLKCEYDRRKELIDSVTFLSLSTETIIKIFSSILYEQKIIFIGNDLGPLTRLINTFICLLYPFSWPHTYVPILPAIMLDIIQAPTPYIIGILRSCELYLSANEDLLSQDNSDIVIIDVDHDRIRSINDYFTGAIHRGSTDNLHSLPILHSDSARFQILPKIFKIELKQEISLLRKTKLSLSLDECQQRLRDVFMSIFVQSCYNYKEYLNEIFQCEEFIQSKQHTIELFLEWFTRTQIFELFIRQKSEPNQFALTFDYACEKYNKTLNKQTPQRITAKSVKRKSATRANKQENRF